MIGVGCVCSPHPLMCCLCPAGVMVLAVLNVSSPLLHCAKLVHMLQLKCVLLLGAALGQ